MSNLTDDFEPRPFSAIAIQQVAMIAGLSGLIVGLAAGALGADSRWAFFVGSVPVAILLQTLRVRQRRRKDRNTGNSSS